MVLSSIALDLSQGGPNVVGSHWSEGFSAEGTTDPDGDRISFRWWQFLEAGTCNQMVRMDDPLGKRISFDAPDVDEPCTIHIILEVEDQGTPELVAYQRLIITVNP